jgi:hypothetical protein
MNRGVDRIWLQRTAIEILNVGDFPRPASYHDGGVTAISGVQPANQAKVDAVFPLPPAFS